MASFLEKVNSFNSSNELRQWAGSAGLESDPNVVQRITNLNEESWFEAVSDPIQLEALDAAQAEEGSQLYDSDLQLIEDIEDMEQNPITGTAYYYCKNMFVFHKIYPKHINHRSGFLIMFLATPENSFIAEFENANITNSEDQKHAIETFDENLFHSG